jgi:hypothetical protein
MKWPAELLLIGHAESAYNSLRKQKNDDPDYCRFLTLLENDPSHPELQPLAVLLHKKHALGHSDRDTPITPVGEAQARTTGREMRASGVRSPDVIFFSPCLRNEQRYISCRKRGPTCAMRRSIGRSEFAKKILGWAFSTMTHVSIS